MEKRPENRVETQIQVRVWGMDSDGRPFFQNVKAANVNSEGALLSGINHPLKVGDVVGVQHEERKARFKVIWVMDGGAARRIDIGIQVLHGQRTPWHELAGGEVDKPISAKNRRRFTRHKIHYPIEIGFEDSRRSHMQTNATDIGGRGCYVETLLPLAMGTCVKVKFWIDSEKVQTGGIVRASDPGVGMGIEFTDLENKVQETLQRHLDKMNEGLASAARDAAAKGASSAD
jgi:PilZ domain-containing protein